MHKSSENGLDGVEIRSGKILVYTKVHEFFRFAISALDEPLYELLEHVAKTCGHFL